MSEKKQKGLVPKLRFPEFQDGAEWREQKLEKIASFSKGKGISKSDVVSNGKQPCIRYGELYTHYKEEIEDIHSYTNLPINNLILSEANDVIIPASGETQEDIATASCVVSKGIALGGDLNIIRSDMNGIFFSYYLNSAKKKSIAQLAQGISVIHLYSNQLKKLTVNIPDIEEQQKIADCLSSIDESISTQTEKLNALKNHKKALMQQLFPAEGETTPKLRFPEFRDGEEWDWGEVGNIYDVTRGYVLSMSIINEKYSEETPYPVYSSQTKNNGLAGYYNEYLYEDAITWTTDGANAGDVNYRNGKFYCTNVCGVLLNNKGFANLCMAELLNTVTRKHVSYVGNPKLMNGVMSKISIPFPKLEEQQKIADCLSFIDELIATQTEKIDMLRTHKKGLMQQLFPLSGEVSDFDLRNS